MRDGVRAAVCSVFGGHMESEWYANIADTDDQAVLLKDIDATRGGP